jgi:HPt (histidine-containing phosphotransfer) domain-containing protein
VPDTKPAKVSTYDWPEFIDREMALKQTSGDEAALLNLARAFVTGFAAYPSEYAEAVDTRDSSRLELLTHRVKGAAGYIGDTKVHELAKTLELEVKNGKLPTGNELGDLVGEHIKYLQPLLAEIRTESVKAISSSELEQVTSELLAAYSDNCFTPQNEWKPYVAGLRAEGFDSMAQELEQALEVNDFNSAASILTEIRASIEKRAQKR